MTYPRFLLWKRGYFLPEGRLSGPNHPIPDSPILQRRIMEINLPMMVAICALVAVSWGAKRPAPMP